jgi:hypothetical protein
MDVTHAATFETTPSVPHEAPLLHCLHQLPVLRLLRLLMALKAFSVAKSEANGTADEAASVWKSTA